MTSLIRLNPVSILQLLSLGSTYVTKGRAHTVLRTHPKVDQLFLSRVVATRYLAVFSCYES
jgi:hypothetical protein